MSKVNDLDIIDTQAHIGPGQIERTLSAMDALGIRGLVIEEYWLENYFNFDPHETLEVEPHRNT